MAYLTVTTQVDVVNPSDGKLSLREAVAQANTNAGADVIRFTAAVVGKQLVLTGGELVVTDSLTIDGGGSGVQTTLDANRASRVMSVKGNATTATLTDLVLTNGQSNGEAGGGIALTGGAALVLTDAAVTGNDSTVPGDYTGKGGDGGGIFAGAGSRVTLLRSTVEHNAASAYYGGGNGGGIAGAGSNTISATDSAVANNRGVYGGGIFAGSGSQVTIERTSLADNWGGGFRWKGGGGGLYIKGGTAEIYDASISGNFGYGSGGGGILARSSTVSLSNCTLADNETGKHYGAVPGGAILGGTLRIANCTITGNRIPSTAGYDYGHGAGIAAAQVTLSNSILAGNFDRDGIAQDVADSTVVSNGHNVLGSTVTGSIPGDRQNVPPAQLFAQLDPVTGGGKLAASGIVPLKSAVGNPAVSGGDPLAARALDQLGTARPLPAGSLPDIGAAEIDQPLSTKTSPNNDVRTGTNAADSLLGYAGNDLLRGLGGGDSMDGGDGSDVLEGGPGNDTLKGGLGVDLVTYPGPAAVTVDLSATPATAKRGGETDTLIGIEGAIGSDGADIFKGSSGDNEFQGGLGKDTYTGGGGRDVYDFDKVQDSPAGASRDVIKDFVPGQDVIDLAGVDGDRTTPGNQAFRWVGKATLTGTAQLGYYVSGNTTIVRASNDADAAPEIEIQLNGVKTLTPADFRF